MFKQRIAGIISIILDPLVEGPILLAIFFLNKSLLPLRFMVTVIILDTLLPILFMIYGLKRGFITDWETTNRNERHRPNFIFLLIILFNLSLFYLLNDRFLMKIFWITLTLVGLYALITFFWKISGHMMANTGFFLGLNIFFGWRFWWLIVLLPLVAWARLVRNKHNVWQLLGGIILSGLVILCGSSFLF